MISSEMLSSMNNLCSQHMKDFLIIVMIKNKLLRAENKRQAENTNDIYSK